MNLADLRIFLESQGCVQDTVLGRNQYDIWKATGRGVTRPAQFSSRIDPVPDRIVHNALRDLNIPLRVLEQFLAQSNLSPMATTGTANIQEPTAPLIAHAAEQAQVRIN